MQFSNPNPTKAEKAMFKNHGLYLTFKDKYIHKYVPVHLDNQKTYPASIDVEDNAFEWNSAVIFDDFTETVTIHTACDKDLIEAISDRMKELNYR